MLRKRFLECATWTPHDLKARTGLTKYQIKRGLSRLVQQRIVMKEGATRSALYRVVQTEVSRAYAA
jgi:predicted HTH transcriptional regulator